MQQENKKWLEENYPGLIHEDDTGLYFQDDGKTIYFHITKKPLITMLKNEGYHIFNCEKPFNAYIMLIINYILEGKDEKVFFVGSRNYASNIEKKCFKDGVPFMRLNYDAAKEESKQEEKKEKKKNTFSIRFKKLMKKHKAEVTPELESKLDDHDDVILKHVESCSNKLRSCLEDVNLDNPKEFNELSGYISRNFTGKVREELLDRLTREYDLVYNVDISTTHQKY